MQIVNQIKLMSFVSMFALFFNCYADLRKLPIGMNVQEVNYYTTAVPFNDLKMSSSEWITFNASGPSEWDTQKSEKIKKDPQGYPLEIPAKIIGEEPQAIRFLINNQNPGHFIFLYDGTGTFNFTMPHRPFMGDTIITLDGKGGNSWVDILTSSKDDHVRNIQILPYKNKYEDTPIFDDFYLEGLKPFHCLRFMDWMKTNNSPQESWDSRVLPDHHTQGGDKGAAIEHAVALCNKLNANAWFCIPHKADDNFIKQFAILVRKNLNPNLKVYLEYSNELWNWMFSQSHYVLENAPGALDKYVSLALEEINPKPDDHPEKDAYMMQRTFLIWEDVFSDTKNRLIRVATTQHVWYDNTRRILEFLFKKNENGKQITNKYMKYSVGKGCNVVSPAGYFSYNQTNKDKWLSMNSNEVTAEIILKAVNEEYEKESGFYTDKNAQYAKAWNIGYVVYEGGQHLLPLKPEKDSPYNLAIWNSQIDPEMYNIYKKLLTKHASEEVNCSLFCPYLYVGKRESIFGSWGHLESLEQLQEIKEVKKIAPKYSAILDFNTPK